MTLSSYQVTKQIVPRKGAKARRRLDAKKAYKDFYGVFLPLRLCAFAGDLNIGL
jgi:hypothetical protein